MPDRVPRTWCATRSRPGRADVGAVAGGQEVVRAPLRTLKPSEQREVAAKIAWPPERNGATSPVGARCARRRRRRPGRPRRGADRRRRRCRRASRRPCSRRGRSPTRCRGRWPRPRSSARRARVRPRCARRSAPSPTPTFSAASLDALGQAINRFGQTVHTTVTRYCPPDYKGPATRTRISKDMKTSRADLHCHSTASQVSKLGVQRALGLPECATPPEEVYALAKRRGMDFVTITDHDTIDGVLRDRRPARRLRLRGADRLLPRRAAGGAHPLPRDHAGRPRLAAGPPRRRRGRRAATCTSSEITCALAHPFYAVEAPLQPAPPPPAGAAVRDLGGPQRRARP